MKTYIILYNIIVEDECDDTDLDNNYNKPSRSSVELSNNSSPDFDAFLHHYHAVHNSDKYYQLRNNLIEHL